ncbi:glycosyltransferase family 2 protein [Leisingera aquaemixtae]|uniref:glycosyltransferase family 2 protein n=1 Tax=Leisingera aquaemixtae TaxID=1396826 RepID=UPI0021A67C54|nr:glycosyltransferase family 2 protein [Leisingera aquaemixtae]UWQ37571.1 glycosyltransferase family 2 protein [Leisingera aquaemixtae]
MTQDTGRSGTPNVVVVTTMKDEGAYILDWICHYKSIGVSDFVVFTNDCSDPTDHILRCLHRMGVVEHRFNRVMRRGPHKSALMWAEYEPKVAGADWVLVVDVDEFLQINTADGTLPGLLAERQDADAVSFVWRIFGNAGVGTADHPAVPQAFVRAEPEEGQADEHRFFKTAFRNNGKFERMGVHRPFLAVAPEDVNWQLADGTRLPQNELEGVLYVRGSYGYSAAQLNHYALRSRDGFLNKKARGRANHFTASIEPGYWHKFDRNEEEDRRLADNLADALEIKEDLLRDASLREYHEMAQIWHRRRGRKARISDEGQAFLKAMEESRKNA